MRFLISFVAVLLLPLSAPTATFAQNASGAATPSAASSSRVGSATVVSKAPVIDGRLGAEEWQGGQLLDSFVQREPLEGLPISERTEVRVLTDGEALYVGAWLYDRQASGIVMSEKIRDVTLTNSDYFGFILDTYLDRQNGFLFGTTPSGVEYDAQVMREGEGGGAFQQGQTRAQSGSMGGVNLNWDASWTVATSVDSAGWYAEFRIPFSTLRYGGGSQVWGFNIMRGIRRKNEEGVWSRVPRQFGITRLSQAGTLEGLEVPVRRVTTATPYLLGASSRTYATQSKFVQPTDWGVDVKYGITPALTLDLTYNTDFAQVEVDEQRTNLTRFQLFFPEKRPFFLENAGVFSAGTPQAVDLFFTRRIGIDAATGQPQPIVGGGRLTGRIGGVSVGALQLFTDDAGASKGNSFTVARVLKEVSARSRVGVIGVQRMSTRDGDDYNRTFGVDGRLGLGQDWTVDAWAARTETPGKSGNDFAFSSRVAYQTREWNNSVRYLQVGRDFNPEVGFVSRPAGYRFFDASTMRLVRSSDWTRLRQWNPHINYRAAFGLDGFYQTGTIHVDVTEIELNSGTRFGPEMNISHEGLDADFAIVTADPSIGRRAIVIPKGQYDWATFGFDFFTNASAPVSFTGRVDVGEFYTGTRRGGNVNLTARHGSAVSSTFLLDYQDIRLDEGAFIRKLVGMKVAYFFTPRVFVQSLTQYNNQQRIWTANMRFAWLNTAGTGLFVVLNSGETADGFFRHREHVTRSFIVKYTRQLGTGR